MLRYALLKRCIALTEECDEVGKRRIVIVGAGFGGMAAVKAPMHMSL